MSILDLSNVPSKVTIFNKSDKRAEVLVGGKNELPLDPGDGVILKVDSYGDMIGYLSQESKIIELNFDYAEIEHIHSITKIPAKEPTCTAAGHIEYYRCGLCGKYFSDAEGKVEIALSSTVIPAKGHTYSKETTDPTCTEQGYTVYTCAICGHSYKSDYTPAVGHSYSSKATAPTCIDKGYTTHTCSKCGHSYIDSYVNATGHSWNAGEITTQPTHITFGIKTFTCSVCGETKTEQVPKLTEHEYGNWVAVDDSAHKKTCACGDVITESHTWDNGTITKQPTHLEFGEKLYTCSGCGRTKTEPIEKTTEHSYGAWENLDSTYHQKVCACGDVVKEAHSWSVGTVVKAATHTEFGEMSHVCSICGATKTELIPKLTEHTYGEWTQVDGDTHQKVCECGDTVIESHIYGEWEITKEATETETGSKQRVCSVCGYIQTEEIPIITVEPATVKNFILGTSATGESATETIEATLTDPYSEEIGLDVNAVITFADGSTGVQAVAPISGSRKDYPYILLPEGTEIKAAYIYDDGLTLSWAQFAGTWTKGDAVTIDGATYYKWTGSEANQASNSVYRFVFE